MLPRFMVAMDAGAHVGGGTGGTAGVAGRSCFAGCWGVVALGEWAAGGAVLTHVDGTR